MNWDLKLNSTVAVYSTTTIRRQYSCNGRHLQIVDNAIFKIIFQSNSGIVLEKFLWINPCYPTATFSLKNPSLQHIFNQFHGLLDDNALTLLNKQKIQYIGGFVELHQLYS